MELSITISSVGTKSTPIVLQGSYQEQIWRAKALGYNQVELHIRDPKSLDLDPIIRALEETCVQVSTLGTGQAYVNDRLSFSSFDSEIRQAAVQRIKDHIQLASLLGAKVIIGSIKGILPSGDLERREAYCFVVDCLKDCLNEAERHGIHLSLEAINRYETNFLNTAAETVYFIRQFESKRLGLLLDTFHMNIEEISLEETVRRYGKYLSHIHIADSNRQAPGRGHIDFPKLIEELRRTGYRGSLGLECLPLPDPQTAAQRGLDYLGGLLKTTT